MTEIPAEAVQAAEEAMAAKLRMLLLEGEQPVWQDHIVTALAAAGVKAVAPFIAEQARAEERAAIIAGIRSYFAPVDDPLYEDVKTLCGRIERGEYATRQTGGDRG